MLARTGIVTYADQDATLGEKLGELTDFASTVIGGIFAVEPIVTAIEARFAPKLRFETLQAVVRYYSGPMNAFFKSGGKVVPKKFILKAYKELIERILMQTKGAPLEKVTEAAIKAQSKRLQMIIEALEKL
jgi:hypothetical protein